MLARASRPATWEDLVAAPPHMTAELIHGELILQPRPAFRHARAARRIANNLDGGGSESGVEGWVIEVEVELHLGRPDPRHLVLVPDISGWRTDRLPDPSDLVAVEVVPDWVCEVLSPGTHRHDRLVKMDVYASVGVPWAWLVDPAEGTLEVYRLQDGGWARAQVGGPGDRITVQPFGIEVDLDRWFRRSTPTPPP